MWPFKRRTVNSSFLTPLVTCVWWPISSARLMLIFSWNLSIDLSACSSVISVISAIETNNPAYSNVIKPCLLSSHSKSPNKEQTVKALSISKVSETSEEREKECSGVTRSGWNVLGDGQWSVDQCDGLWTFEIRLGTVCHAFSYCDQGSEWHVSSCGTEWQHSSQLWKQSAGDAMGVLSSRCSIQINTLSLLILGSITHVSLVSVREERPTTCLSKSYYSCSGHDFSLLTYLCCDSWPLKNISINQVYISLSLTFRCIVNERTNERRNVFIPHWFICSSDLKEK